MLFRCQTPGSASGSTACKRRNYYRNKRVSQKVINHRTLAVLVLLRLLFSAVDLVLWRGIEDVEVSLPRVTYFKDTGEVPASVAVVRSTPHRTQTVVIENLIPFLAQLMRSQNMRHAIHLEEFSNDLRTECVTGSSG